MSLCHRIQLCLCRLVTVVCAALARTAADLRSARRFRRRAGARAARGRDRAGKRGGRVRLPAPAAAVGARRRALGGAPGPGL